MSEGETHPSYAVLGITRVQSTPPVKLFGSSYRHSYYISLTLRHATVYRSLSNTHSFGGEEIVSVSMSPAQFAEMVTNHGCGFGVPVTLEHLHGKRIEPPPDVNERATIMAEFKQTMKDLGAEVDEIIAKAEVFQTKPNITKADREEFRKMAQFIQAKINSCLPFIHSQFSEAMDKTVAEAKSEMEAGVSSVLKQAGLEKINELVGKSAIEAAAKQIEI